HAVSKDSLADFLWGDSLPTDYFGALESHVSVLRGRLQPGIKVRQSVIRTEPGGYRFVAEQATVDLDRFDALVADAGRPRPPPTPSGAAGPRRPPRSGSCPGRRRSPSTTPPPAAIPACPTPRRPGACAWARAGARPSISWAAPRSWPGSSATSRPR